MEGGNVCPSSTTVSRRFEPQSGQFATMLTKLLLTLSCEIHTLSFSKTRKKGTEETKVKANYLRPQQLNPRSVGQAEDSRRSLELCGDRLTPVEEEARNSRGMQIRKFEQGVVFSVPVRSVFCNVSRSLRPHHHC